MKHHPHSASEIQVFAAADGKDKLTLYDRLEDAEREAHRLGVEIRHLKCAPRLFDDEGGFPVELHRPPDEPEYDYEPEYDLHAAFEQNRHAYWNVPSFRELMDRLGDPQQNAEHYSPTRKNPFPDPSATEESK